MEEGLIKLQEKNMKDHHQRSEIPTNMVDGTEGGKEKVD